MKSDIAGIRNIRKEQLDALYEISRLLNAAHFQESLIEEALDLVVKTIQAERALFVRYHAEYGEFRIISARNVAQETITDLAAFSSGILQQVIDCREATLYHDVQSDPGISQFESIRIHQIKSVIGVPVFYNGEIWGVILADSIRNRQAFTEENLLFLRFFANMVSLALDKILQFEHLQNENRVLRQQLENAASIPEMIGQSPAMKQLTTLIHKVAQTDANVLILGESGTGKDLAARAVHQLSPRREKPYLAQFCGSIPDSLLESELFGYKKGAFTGAHADKQGLFEAADGGTFFLDEIADISLALQAKLLRVIQNQEIIRLGDTRVKKVNVRIIAATNRDLKQLVKEGRFRQDLFYRLNVFPITMPPLCERISDIPVLARHFIEKHGSRARIEPAAMKKLESGHWPGNVRQLENVIQRALILCESGRIQPDHIFLEEEPPDPEQFGGTLRELEMLLLRKRLDQFSGNRTRAAKSLGVSVRWIQLKLKDKSND